MFFYFFLFFNNTDNKLATDRDTYISNGYYICNIRTGEGLNAINYDDVAVKADEVTSYKEGKSFMMSLHWIEPDNISIVSTNDITNFYIKQEGK